MSDDKFILDACCGPRYMWTNKNHPNVIYIDNRTAKKESTRRPSINPDIVMDFRNMTFEDNSFRLVVFDPPHLKANQAPNDSKMNLKRTYGTLHPLTWRRDIKQGFDECWRVLEEFGILIFKWNVSDISYKEILKVIGKEPLFQQKSGNSSRNTYWSCFMKITNQPQQTLTKEVIRKWKLK